MTYEGMCKRMMLARPFSIAVLATAFVAGACSSSDSPQDTPDASDAPDACGPGNCEGCCEGDACKAGTTTDACGVGGSICVACPQATPVCAAGKCEAQHPSCGPSTCAGCCMNDTCQAGTTTIACGKGGAVCVGCKTNQVCRSDQACGVDPTGSWLVWPSSAKITATNNGTSWDSPDSPPDVEVQMMCGTTSEIESYTPTWTKGSGCTMKASELLKTPWFGYQLWDVDAVYDDPITDWTQYHVTEDDFVAGKFTVGPTGGMITMTVEMQKQ